MNRNAPFPDCFKFVANPAVSMGAVFTWKVLGSLLRSSAQANRLVVKLIVPDVSIPIVRYSRWRVSSHSLASELSGLAVIAKVLVEIPFAFLASSMLVFVLPLTDMITRFFPLFRLIFVSNSYGSEAV